MAVYNLQPGEAFVLQADHVRHGGFLATYGDQLLLTSHNLVLLKKGMLGGMATQVLSLDRIGALPPQEIRVFPLHQIKVFQGHAQAVLGNPSNGYTLDVYFHGGVEHFGFEHEREATYWSQKIDEVITGAPVTMISPNSSGTAQIAAAMKETVDVFKETFGIQSKPKPSPALEAALAPSVLAAGRCIDCGAPISGAHGQATPCSYCGTENVLGGSVPNEVSRTAPMEGARTTVPQAPLKAPPPPPTPAMPPIPPVPPAPHETQSPSMGLPANTGELLQPLVDSMQSALKPSSQSVTRSIIAMGLLVALAIGGLFILGGMSLYEVATRPKDSVAVPQSSSALNGQNYKNVMTQFRTAGFTSVATATVDDLVVGWLNKDGDVSEVSVNGTTDFEASSRFPKGATVVVTYHTFSKDAPEKASETPQADAPASQAAAPTPQSTAPPADTAVLTAKNNTELKAVLNVQDDQADPKVIAFVQKYAGRTIEFDGYTIGWIRGDGTLHNTVVWVGDVKNANTSTIGPLFRVEGFSLPDNMSADSKANVRVTARVDSWDESHQYIRITVLSLKPR